MHITTWKNPTDKPVEVRLYHGQPPKGQKAFEKVIFAPGEERMLDGKYDAAIHTTHHGVVMGGQAPQLLKIKTNAAPVEALPVHRSILDAAKLGDWEREKVKESGRAGDALTGDEAAELRARLARLEQSGAEAANLAKSLEAANARAAQAEQELAAMKAASTTAKDQPSGVAGPKR